MLTYQLRDIYNKNFERKTTKLPNILVLHQQKNQRTGQEARRSRVRKNRRMAEIINLAKKNLAAGKIIKVNPGT